ncbi:tetratricopeptide repeat-containing sensor histidine kinase [Albibacterium bauzanense]|uniref:histidine kinase n=1 Tax=Albibacterium bauzanense TaxID=653929 RepID=A0A4R1M2I4_9SPHI|nr:ATP-binding protein [Albibacterium bauzanense]TCK85054.1 histidine kinase [Albibacterium bauzanense]
MCRFFLYLIFALLPLIGFGQSVDSLEKVLTTKKLTEGEKIKLYQDLSDRYSNLNMQKSLEYAKTGLTLALQTKDKKAEALFYQNMSLAYLKGGVYDSATIYLDKALPIAQKLEDAKLEATLNRVYGSLHAYQNKYDLAMDYYKKSAGILEKINDTYELCQTYAGIGGVYRLLSNDDQAMVYYIKAEQMAIESGNRERLADIYLAMSYIYRNQEMSKEEVVQPIKQAVKIYQETGNKFGENQALATLANTYSYYDDYVSALPIAQQALQQTEEAGFSNLISTSATILSAIYYYTGKYEECITTGLKVLQIDSADVNLTKHAYIHLSLAYGQLGQIDSMEYYVNQFVTALEEQHNETFHNTLSEMEVKYETEKKEFQISTLQSQRKLYLLLGITGGLILIIALAFVVIRYRLAVSRRKLAEEETQRLEQEKQLVAVQATLDGETAERSRLARDLHDGLGSMLSLVKINLPQVKGNAILEAVDVSRFQKALGMLDDSIQELRRVAHHMMPESLLRSGLKVSLTDFCTAIPTVRFHYFGDEARLSGNLEIMIYRCIHELVNNALKHAEATQINVQLIQEDNRVSFTVQDDGKGFNQQKVTEGMGLQNIRQRVAAFQGKMEIYSSEDGTEVHVELKLTKSEHHD